jgi:hypothetical protein
LNLDLVKDKRNARFEAVGGLLRPCSPLNKCLDKVIEPSPRAKSSHRFEWRLLELTTLHKTLVSSPQLINHYDSKVGIAAIGGVVEQLSRSYRHFKLPNTTGRALIVVLNLACCSIGKQKVIETGGIEFCLP